MKNITTDILEINGFVQRKNGTCTMSNADCVFQYKIKQKDKI